MVPIPNTVKERQGTWQFQTHPYSQDQLHWTRGPSRRGMKRSGIPDVPCDCCHRKIAHGDVQFVVTVHESGSMADKKPSVTQHYHPGCLKTMLWVSEMPSWVWHYARRLEETAELHPYRPPKKRSPKSPIPVEQIPVTKIPLTTVPVTPSNTSPNGEGIGGGKGGEEDSSPSDFWDDGGSP